MHSHTRSGQSLMELLVGIAVGAIFVIGAATIVAPSLRVNTQAGNVQEEAELGQEMLSNVRSWAQGGWGAVLALGTTTANKYYLANSTSPFTAASTTAGESILACSGGGSTGYSYGRAITINAAQVSSTQTNFPILFSLASSSYLATTAHGGSVTNANGYDIIFTSDAAGSNILSFEQASYSSSTGAVNYWIKIPTLSSSANTLIYMWYGNSNISTSQANPTAVWSNGYVLVAHLLNTSNLVNSVTGVAMTNHGGTNAAGGGISFNGSSYIDTGFSLGSTPLPLTTDVWFNHASSGGDNPAGIIGNLTGGSNGFSGTQLFNSFLRSFVLDSSGGDTYQQGSTAISNNTWYKATAVLSSVSSLSQYVNGVPDGSTAQTGASGLGASAQNVYIGLDYPGEHWAGTLEEIRLSNVARSSGWVATEYNNQSATSTFYSVGSPSVGSGTSCVTYNRYFYLTDIYRDSSGNPTTASSSNFYDPSTKLVNVVVGMASSTAPPLSYSLYITRTGDNALSQTNWGGGSGQSGPVTFVSSTYATATSVIVTASGTLTLGTGPAAGGACYDAQTVSSLVGDWMMNEGSGATATDSGTGGNVGTWFGTASGNGGAHYVSGGHSQTYAGYFDGSDDYVSAGTTAIPIGSSPRTLSIWFKLPSGNVASPEELFGSGTNSGSGSRYALWMQGGVGGCAGGYALGVEGNGIAMLAAFTPDSSWHMLTASFPAGATDIGSSTIYLDGAPLTSCYLVGGTVNSTADAVNIGRLTNYNGYYFSGYLEDALMYARGLSATEVSTLYSGGTVN